MADFTMPSLGADMESGELLEWMVKQGDHVKRGDIIAIVGTEKGEIEVEVFEEGIVESLTVAEGTNVPVGTVLAVMRSANGHVAPTRTPAAEKAPKISHEAEVAQEEAHPMDHHALRATAPAETLRIRVSPLARKLAQELGVDLHAVRATGQNGVIKKADVEAAARQSPEPAQAEPPMQKARAAAVETTVASTAKAGAPSSGMRRAIARAMSRANTDIPHYYVETRIDMSRAQAWLEAENGKRSIKDRVLPAVLMVGAVAKALVQVPQLNGFWQNDQLEPQEGIHIGFAIALRQGGLVTPAIHHADLKSMDELMGDLRDLILRTRAGRLRSSELTDPTITLTNLGDLGVETVYGVIYPPQVALVGFGKTIEQAWVENGMIGIRPVVKATLAGDHRATDGRTGAQFLDALNKLLQDPGKIWT